MPRCLAPLETLTTIPILVTFLYLATRQGQVSLRTVDVFSNFGRPRNGGNPLGAITRGHRRRLA